jgi:hypothetical protein
MSQYLPLLQRSQPISDRLCLFTATTFSAATLTNLPSELTAGRGASYLGWTVIGLALIAVWPARQVSQERRRVAGLLLLALMLLWLSRGPESLHGQLRRMFEFATVKRYVEPGTQHLLGLWTIPLFALALSVFFAVGGVLQRRPGWTIGTIITATAAAMVWWGTSPASLAGAVARFVRPTQGSATLTALVLFPLICGTAVGFQRLCTASRTRRGRMVVWLCVLVLIAADLGDPTQRAVDRARQPSIHACAARTYENEREWAQASPSVSVKGLPNQLGAPLPLVQTSAGSLYLDDPVQIAPSENVGQAGDSP